MKTAMQWLIEFIDSEILSNNHYDDSPRLKLGASMAKVRAEQLLEKEKQQIIDVVVNVVKLGTEREGFLLFTEDDRMLITQDAEQYYNETFNDKNKA